jgi:tellurite resistance protein TehA-like permease
MASLQMEQRAHAVRNFVTIQLIALIGWIIVQSLFTYFSQGYRLVPFWLVMVVETIWWIATLVIMFMMFRRIYDNFVQNVLELEEANRKLRERTNTFLMEQVDKGKQGESAV